MDPVILVVTNVTHEPKNMVYFMSVVEKIVLLGVLMYLVSFFSENMLWKLGAAAI